MTVDWAVAGLVFNIIQTQMSSGASSSGGGGSAEGRYIRVKDLRPSEILALLGHWEANASKAGLVGIRIVISREEAPEGVPETYLSEPGKAITFYRNNNKNGLVYIQTRAGSEEAGLESMFTIRDRLIMDELREGSTLPGMLARIGWPPDALVASPPPEISRACVEVLRGLSVRKSVSLREFVAFFLETCSKVAAEGKALEASRIFSLVGESLPGLRLFPDPSLWVRATTEQARGRRLWVNSCHSDLANASGVQQDAEDLAEKAKAFVFRDADGQPLEAATNGAWQTSTAAYCAGRSPDVRRRIPLEIFEQLFAPDTAGKKLGERVRSEIGQAEEGRLVEFDALDVEKGLDEGSEKDAVAFLEATPAEGCCPLRDLLQAKTLRMVMRIAYPRPESFANPIIKLLEVVQERLEDGTVNTETEYRVHVKLDRKTSPDLPSRGLFTFLYGPTLKEISDRSRNGAGALALEIDPNLLRMDPPPGVIDQEAEGEEVQTITWSPIRIEIHLQRKGEDGSWEPDPQFVRLAWAPAGIQHLALSWIATRADELPRQVSPLRLAGDREFGQWLDGVVGRRHEFSQGLEGPTLETIDEVVRQAVNRRKEFLEELRETGFSSGLLERYCVAWDETLRDAKENLVPRGVRCPDLEALLALDVIHLRDGEEAYMLPIHPMRLNWVGEYLQYLEKALSLLLEEGRGLDSVNALYHDRWLKRLTPHKHPPVLSTMGGKLLVPVEEEGWSERFVLLKRDGGISQEWAATIDAESVQAIAEQILEYVHAHPHKLDGLSILVVLPSGGSFPAAIVSKVRAQRELAALPVEVVALAPRGDWDEIVATFEKVQEGEARNFESGRFAPPLNLRLIDYIPATAPARIREQRTDLAVLPHFFGNRVQVNEHTESPELGEGAFHPLHDPTSYIDRDSGNGTVSVVLRPRWNSDCLDNWSTLIVRQFRSEPISPTAPQNVDFVKLRIRFEDAADLFMALHEAAHWVVTLDQYVGRDQLENLPHRPDVLLVKGGVGTGGLYSMVISSNFGRDFVIPRLVRKVNALGISRTPERIQAMAEDFYEEARTVYPGLILRSTGLAKTTQEVLGLMMAKRIVEQHFPVQAADGIAVWIPLDEHASWFDSGSTKTRADLCRIVVDMVEGRAQVSVLVLEGKFRQAHDPSGTQQAAASLKLMRSILDTGTMEDGLSEEARHLRRLWWNELVAAMENVSPEASSLFEKGERKLPRTNARVPEKLAEKLRRGDFTLESARAVYSSAIYENGSQSKCFEDHGVKVIVSGREEIKRILEIETGSPDGLPPGSVDPCDQGPGSGPIGVGSTCEPHDAEPPGGINKAEVSETIHSEIVASRADNESTSIHAVTDQVPPMAATRMSQAELETRYQRVLSAFQEVGIEVTIPDEGPRHIEGPAFIQFRVGTGMGVDPKRLRERGDLLKMRLRLPADAHIRFGIGDGSVIIEVPKEDKDRYFVNAEEMWCRWSGPKPGHLEVPLGEDQTGVIISLDFSSSPSPHLLIGGTTGSGKSEALNTILSGLAKYYTPQQLRLCLVDPKGTEFLAYETIPHLLGSIGMDDEDAENLLSQACEEMQARYARMKEARVRSLPEYNAGRDPQEQIPWWVIVLDEYADLTSDPDRKRSIEALLKRLTQKARAAGIHIIVATQKPSAEVINTTLRSNLPVQLALRTRSAIESRVIMDESGAETLNGKGDALIHKAEGVVRIQCAIRG